MSNPPVTITAKDFVLTDALRTYVTEKIGRLGRFSRHTRRLGVELDVDRAHRQGLIHRVQVWVYLPSKTLKAGVRAEQMRAAIDIVYPKLERQIVSYERKKRDRLRGTRI